MSSRATGRLLTLVLAGLTVFVLALSLPGAARDAVSQWLILGVSHPGAALVVGPVLIAAPYAAARGLANRFTTAPERPPAP